MKKEVKVEKKGRVNEKRFVEKKGRVNEKRFDCTFAFIQ